MSQIVLNQTLPDDRRIVLQIDESDASLLIDDKQSATLKIITRPNNLLSVQISDICLANSEAAASMLVLVLHILFDNKLALNEIQLSLGMRTDLLELLRYLGLAVVENEAVVSRRSLLRQLPELWLTKPRSYPFPLIQSMTEGKRHPLRPTVTVGEVYRHFLPELGEHISFRTVDSNRDLDIFNAWHNNPRVSAFWELAGSKDMHREYLQKVTADAHMHPVFGCFDDKPFGYFEIYWAKEDRIAPYYDVDDYDRGVHMLVGDEQLRGPHRVAAWLPSLVHFMFLDDPRTRHVVAEPRADNAKMIGYMQQAGFYKAKEFDFPHKRAAMMMLSREAFFEQFCV